MVWLGGGGKVEGGAGEGRCDSLTSRRRMFTLMHSVQSWWLFNTSMAVPA